MGRNILQHLVGRHAPHQHEEAGVVAREFAGKLLHEGIVDADIRQRAADGAGNGADGNAEQRIEEEDADQQAPETARGGAGRRRVEQLVELDFAIGGFRGDDGVADRDQILFLKFEDALTNFFGFFFARIDSRNKIRHFCLLDYIVYSIGGRKFQPIMQCAIDSGGKAAGKCFKIPIPRPPPRSIEGLARGESGDGIGQARDDQGGSGDCTGHEADRERQFRNDAMPARTAAIPDIPIQ